MRASRGSSTNARPEAAAAGPTSSSACARDAATQSVDYDLQLDGARRHVRALLIAFANGREYGLGARIAPGAELDDGLLDTAIVEECRVMARFWHARHLAMGTAHLAPNVSTLRVTHAIIEREGDDGIPRRRRTRRRPLPDRSADAPFGAQSPDASALAASASVV